MIKAYFTVIVRLYGINLCQKMYQFYSVYAVIIYQLK